MPSTTELYLILRARDEASRVVRAFGAELALLDRVAHKAAMNQFMAGAAVASIGVGITSVGVLAVNALNNMTNSAIEYNEEVAKTLTQVDQVGISFNDLSEMGKRVARNVPVAFEEIQPALYDIFSSIDVNAPQAEQLLTDIGKAAVGGTTDMETAGRALISILNAYKMPVSEASKVSDIMFKLVQKGVGTYEEFTSVIGRAVPSAIKAGQSFADLAGMMAFLTRNGQSTANAATSAARALDMFSKPSAIKELKALGIAVADSTGKFRPILDIITELLEKMQKFGSVGAAKKLNEIFKGSGANIQAMRFMNLAVDDQLGLLRELTKEIRNAGGEAQKAYTTMANTPQGQLQALNNEYQVMVVTIGQQLLPIKLALARALNTLLEWWNNLSPSVRTAIVVFVGVSAVLSILIGIVLVFTGAIIMMAAAWTLAEAALAPFIAVVLPIIGIAAAVVAGIIAIAVVFKLLYDRSAVMREAVSDLVDTLKELWNTIVNSVKGAFKSFVDMLGGPTRIMNAFKLILTITGAYLQAVFKVALTAATYIIKGLGIAISLAWKGLEILFKVLQMVANIIIGAVRWAMTYLKKAWDWIIENTGPLGDAILSVGQGIQQFFTSIPNMISGLYNNAVQLLQTLVNSAIDGLNALITAYNALPWADDVSFISHVNWVQQEPAMTNNQLANAVGGYAGQVIRNPDTPVVDAGWNPNAGNVNERPGREGDDWNGNGGGSGGSSGQTLAEKELDRVKQSLSDLKQVLEAAASAYKDMYGYTQKLFGQSSQLEKAFGKDSDIDSAISMYQQLDGALMNYYESLINSDEISDKVKKGLVAAEEAQRSYLENAVKGLVTLYQARKDLQDKLVELDKSYADQQKNINDLYDRLDKEAEASIKSINAHFDVLIPQLENALSTVSAAYDKENKILEDLVSARNRFLEQIESGFRSYANDTSEGNFLNSLKKRTKDLTSFVANINTLMTKGLDPTLIQDFIAAGFSSSGSTVAQLAKADPTKIAEINTLQTGLADLTKDFQNTVNGVYYQSGINAQASIVNPLKMAMEAAQAALTAAKLDKESQLLAAQLLQDTLKQQRQDALAAALADYEAHKGEIQKQIDDINLQITAAATAIQEHFAKLLDPETGLPVQLTKIGRQAVRGLIKGMQSQKEEAIAEVKKLGAEIVEALRIALDIHSPSRKSYEAGSLFILGLVNAIRDGRNLVGDEVGRLNEMLQVEGAMGGYYNGRLSTTQPYSANEPQQIIQQDIVIHTQEIDPVKHAADLGWEFATRVRL